MLGLNPHTAKAGLLSAVLLLGMLSTTYGDWPTYQHDIRRSGVTDETLTLPLAQSWVNQSLHPPDPAWTGPAKWDAWAGNRDLQSMRNFDPCFFVTASEGRVFYGSSVDDAVHAVDLATGAEQWVFFTGAAVRFPPTLHAGWAYFGSDDGTVCCCDQASGELVWKKNAGPENRAITSNRKIISTWPVRTGVLVHEGHAFFAGSLVPWETSVLWKVDALTGNHLADDCFRREVAEVTLQGAMLASSDRLYLPQGRAAPLAFDIASGKSQGAIGEAGGVFCVLTEDELLVAGPADQKSADNQIRIADGSSRRKLATFGGANRILIDGTQAWVPTDGKLRMLDRKAYVDAQAAIDAAAAKVKLEKPPTEAAQNALAAAKADQAAAWRWEVKCATPQGFIKAGDKLVIGLSNQVRVLSAVTGQTLWSNPLNGIAHGLAVSDGRLLVSTGKGHIYAFAPESLP
ncbi:PQQ-binding-like beta-propeller repeat protein [Planctomycetes bacterium K23_9]|uniref:Outer membrane biogenesis protein BamB n=1 Tax=Stieleria marina TaxID=1930275 RepID=A0A517NPW2_9BACT|nr:outer membrane biogenesis protein BamB [Planctomycetes bacterium K23_9]